MPHDCQPPTIQPLEIGLSEELSADLPDLGAEHHDHALAVWEDEGGAIYIPK